MSRFLMASAQQGVVDAAQLSGGDKDKRVLLLRNVVYRQEIFGKGNHQTAGASTSTVS